MKDMNKVILAGRLGRDPVQRSTKNGIPVTRFSVATARKFKQVVDGEEKLKDETQWHEVVAWGKQAENCALYLKKGSQVLVEGSVRSHHYNTQDGQKRTSFEIHAEGVSFLGRSTFVRDPEAAPLLEIAEEPVDESERMTA